MGKYRYRCSRCEHRWQQIPPSKLQPGQDPGVVDSTDGRKRAAAPAVPPAASPPAAAAARATQASWLRRTVSQPHEHVFPPDHTYNAETDEWTKRCACGFEVVYERC